MKKLLLFLTIFLFFTSCAQQEEVQKKEELKRFEKSTLNFDEDTKVITFSNGENVTGIIFETWENKQVKEETVVKNGKFNGYSKRWYEDGVLAGEAIFNDGELTFSKRYYENGNLFQMMGFGENGKPKDTTKTFYPDESLLANLIFKHDGYSEEVCFDPLGNKINCDLINNGINISMTNKESEPKPIIIRSNATGEPINGLLIKSYPNGAPWYHHCYKDGIMDGYGAAWYENGEKMYVTNYLDGKESGVQRKYLSSGQIRSESEYKNHEPHGFQKTWYEDGILRAENNWLNGKPHGSVKLYATNGKLIKHGTFENGVLISEECFENGKKVDCE